MGLLYICGENSWIRKMLPRSAVPCILIWNLFCSLYKSPNILLIYSTIRYHASFDYIVFSIILCISIWPLQHFCLSFIRFCYDESCKGYLAGYSVRYLWRCLSCCLPSERNKRMDWIVLLQWRGNSENPNLTCLRTDVFVLLVFQFFVSMDTTN